MVTTISLAAATSAGVRIAYAEPSRLGVDRFLALLAAHARGPGPWLLVSAGSALTVDLLDVGGQHIGGVIAPSPEHMRAALAARFPALAYAGGEAHAFGIDARNEAEMIALVDRIESDIGPLQVVVFNIGANVTFGIRDTTARVYRKVWEMAALAGFLVGFGSDADHDSSNFHWFRAHCDRFFYIDRIVVASRR